MTLLSLSADLASLYGAIVTAAETHRLPGLQPFVGSDFLTPSRARLRVLAIGLNSYIGERDIPDCVPEWFPGLVQHGNQQFFRTLRSECENLGTGAIELPGSRWSSRTFESPDGLYGTNAVKRFLPFKTGRWASQVDAKWFAEGSEIWREELRLLADHGALPHVIVVFGARAWWPTCSVLLDLCTDAAEEGHFVLYKAMPETSEVFHRLSVIHVREGGKVRPCVVVRLDHPAAHRRRWNAARMLEQPEFVRKLVAEAEVADEQQRQES